MASVARLPRVSGLRAFEAPLSTTVSAAMSAAKMSFMNHLGIAMRKARRDTFKTAIHDLRSLHFAYMEGALFAMEEAFDHLDEALGFAIGVVAQMYSTEVDENAVAQAVSEDVQAREGGVEIEEEEDREHVPETFMRRKRKRKKLTRRARGVKREQKRTNITRSVIHPPTMAPIYPHHGDGSPAYDDSDMD